MNKSVKAKTVGQAISAKFKGEYEKAFRAVVVAARKFAIANSKHDEFMALKLPTDMLPHINRKRGLRLNTYIDSNVGFINRTTYVSFDDPVYGYGGLDYLNITDLPELADLHKLIKLIEAENQKLTQVVFSYTTAKKLVADLPWTEQYLPTASKCTRLIAAEVIADINAKFSK